jgi:hypothetical protein
MHTEFCSRNTLGSSHLEDQEMGGYRKVSVEGKIWLLSEFFRLFTVNPEQKMDSVVGYSVKLCHL